MSSRTVNPSARPSQPLHGARSRQQKALSLSLQGQGLRRASAVVTPYVGGFVRGQGKGLVCYQLSLIAQPLIRRLKQQGKKPPSCCRLSPPMHPPQGGSKAGPSNITRHYAKWPHARASLVTAATSHNAALCVNGPEGVPQTPPGLTQGGGKQRRRSNAFKSIPAHLGNLVPAAPAAQKARVFRSRRAKLAHPGEKQNRRLRSGLLCLLALQRLAPCSGNQG